MQAKMKLMRLWLFSLLVLLALAASPQAVLAAVPSISVVPTSATYGQATSNLVVTGSSFTLAFSGATTATLGGQTLTQVSNTPSMVTFSLTQAQIETLGAGPFTLTVTNGAQNAGTPFTINMAGTSTGVISSSPSNASTLGDSVTFTATVTSGAGVPGGGTVQFQDNGTNLGTAQTLNASGQASVATSTLTAGMHTIKASYSGITNFGSSFGTVMQTVRPATQLLFVQPPTNAASTAAIAPPVTVKIADSLGNTVTNSTVLVALTLNAADANPVGTLSGTTSVNAIGGIATFSNLSVDKTGSKTLTAASAGLTSAVSSGFAVTPGAASQLAFTSEPSTQTAGNSQTVTIQVEDASSNPSPTAGVQVDLTLNQNAFSTGSTLTGATNAFGAVSFTFAVNTAATGYTLTAADHSGALTSAVSSPAFAILAGAATKVAFTAQPATNAMFASGAEINGASGVVAQLEDFAGNAVAQANVPITVMETQGSGVLSGVTTVSTGATGQAAFALSLDLVGADKQLSADSSGLAAAISNVFTITPGIAAKLVFGQQPPSSATSSATLAPPITVAVEDAAGNLTASTAAVTLTLNANDANPAGTLGGTVTQNAVNGMATFSDLTVDKIGSKTLTAASAGLMPATSAAFVITAGTAATVTISQQPTTNPVTNPASVTTDGNFTLQATVTDASGNLVADGAPVALTLYQADGVTPVADQTILTGGATGTVGGVASFTLNIKTVGTYTLVASSNGHSSATSSPITVTVGAINHVVISQQPPATLSADGAFPVQVQVTDAHGNPISGVAVTLNLTPPTNATLSAVPTTATTDVNGIAAFSAVNINKVGTYTLYAVAGTGSGAVTSAVSSSVTITPGAPNTITISQQPPSTVTAGTTFPVTVTVTDKEGNLAADGTVVSLSLLDISTAPPTDKTSSLSGGSATTSGGIATFSNVAISTTGAYKLIASTIVGTGPGAVTISSNLSSPIAVTASSLTLEFTDPTFTSVTTTPMPASTPVPATGQNNVAVYLKLVDNTGNPVPGVLLTLRVATRSGQAGTISGIQAQPQTTNASGEAAFLGAITAASPANDPYELTITGGGKTVISNDFVVTPGAPALFTFTGPTTAPATTPAKTTADGSFALSVLVTDQYLNPVAAGTPVMLTLFQQQPGGTYIAAPMGVVLIAASTGLPTAPTVAGAVTFNSLNINKVGTYEIGASATPPAPGSAAVASTNASSPINITPGVAASVTISQQPTTNPVTNPASITTDNTFTLQATVLDKNSNSVADGTAVSLTLLQKQPNGTFAAAPDQTILTGATGVTTTGGVASFTLNIKTVGTYELQADSGTATPAVSNPIKVTPGVAATVTISQQPTTTPPTNPATVSADAAFTLQATVMDTSGNPVVDGTPVNLTLLQRQSDGTFAAVSDQSILTGGASTTTGGQANFTLNIKTVGIYELAVTGAVPAVVSNPITVTPGAAATVTISQQPTTTPPTNPATVSADAAFTLQATVKDDHGNLAADNTAVSLTLLQPQPGGTYAVASDQTILTGNTANTVNGIAAFNHVAISKIGTYTLIAATIVGPVGSAVTISSALSSPVTINTGPTATLTVTLNSNAPLNMKTFQPTVNSAAPEVDVTVMDAQGNPLSNVPVTLSLESPVNLTASPVVYVADSNLAGTLTQSSNISGVARFTDLVFTAAGSSLKLLATGGNTNLVSSMFNVVNPDITLSSANPASIQVGSPDTQITLTGSGFDSATQVVFTTPTTGTTPATGTNTPQTAPLTPTILSATSLTVTVPAAYLVLAGGAKIMVTNVTPADPTMGSASGTIKILPLGLVAGEHFPDGLQMLSVPYDYSGTDARSKGVIFPYDYTGLSLSTDDLLRGLETTGYTDVGVDIKLAVWDPMLNSGAGDYELTDPPLTTNTNDKTNLADTLTPGQGYWGRFPDPTATPATEVGLVVRGAAAAVDGLGRFSIVLAPGWNMIGDPFLSGINLSDIQAQALDSSGQPSGSALDLVTANNNGLVSDTFYQYASGTTPGYAPVTAIQTYMGYWVHAYVPCQLLIPQPAGP